jgi:hypothetical protein
MGLAKHLSIETLNVFLVDRNSDKLLPLFVADLDTVICKILEPFSRQTVMHKPNGKMIHEL